MSFIMFPEYLVVVYGVAGGMLVAIILVGSVLFRNWKYEQALDSLTWKIDFKDIKIYDDANKASRVS